MGNESGEHWFNRNVLRYIQNNADLHVSSSFRCSEAGNGLVASYTRSIQLLRNAKLWLHLIDFNFAFQFVWLFCVENSEANLFYISALKCVSAKSRSHCFRLVILNFVNKNNTINNELPPWYRIASLSQRQLLFSSRRNPFTYTICWHSPLSVELQSKYTMYPAYLSERSSCFGDVLIDVGDRAAVLTAHTLHITNVVAYRIPHTERMRVCVFGTTHIPYMRRSTPLSNDVCAERSLTNDPSNMNSQMKFVQIINFDNPAKNTHILQ